MNEPIHVLGAGSIGLLWTASIRSKFPKYPITLLLRDHDRNRRRVAAACEGSNEAGNIHNHRLNISWNNRQLLQQQQISLPIQFIHDPKHEKERIKTLIVATKAHQARQAVESVLDRLLLPATIDCDDNGDDENSVSASNPAQIIVLCNGALSVREELLKILPQIPAANNAISLTLATTTQGAYLSEPDRLVHAGIGTTFLEDLSTDGAVDLWMVDLWNRARLECFSLSSQRMNSMLWNKLAANCVINPLTSIFRCTNGELLMEPSFPELREKILREVAAVAAGDGKKTAESKKKQNDRYVTNSVPTIEEMRDFVTNTIRNTENNKSSMYQDIILRRQERTEIEHLNGYVVRKGKEMGKECPTNEDLCSRITELALQNAHRNE